jgi:hypothetical protein
VAKLRPRANAKSSKPIWRTSKSLSIYTKRLFSNKSSKFKNKSSTTPIKARNHIEATY